jgi:hypothetical protein
MSARLLIEQFHLNVFIPRLLPSSRADALRWTLAGAPFRNGLRRAIAEVFLGDRAFRSATVKLTRRHQIRNSY